MHRNTAILPQPHQQQKERQRHHQQHQDQRYTGNIPTATANHQENFPSHRNATSSDAPALPYSQWTKMVSDNGLVYLAHPQTREVKWLWSRHWDPNSGKDYLVNTITGERAWVTKSNEHLCPVRNPNMTSNTKSNPLITSSAAATSKDSKPTVSIPTHGNLRYDNASMASPSRLDGESINANVSMPGTTNGTSAFGQQGSFKKPEMHSYYGGDGNQTFSSTPTGVGLNNAMYSPQDTTLAPGEVLMTHPGTGRPYAYNTRTKASRWISPATMPGSIHHQTNADYTLSHDATIKNHPLNSPNTNAKVGSPHGNPMSGGVAPIKLDRTKPDSSAGAARPPPSMMATGNAMERSSQTSSIQRAKGQEKIPSLSMQDVKNPALSGHSTQNSMKSESISRPGTGFKKAPTSTSTGTAEANKEKGDGGDMVKSKMSLLDKILMNVEQLTTDGKYNLTALEQSVREVSSNNAQYAPDDLSADDDLKTRLLQLAELLTQNMLKVDAVDSDGNPTVRAKRKLVVNRLLALADKVESLRSILKTAQ